MAAVTATLRADVGQYISALGRAAAATQSFASKSAANIAKNDQHINKLANGAGLLGTAMAVGLGAAVKSAANFDQAMSNVAATGDDARGRLDDLRKMAIDMGASTQFSATEAAQGIENLSKAGVSASDTLGGGLKGALDLAAAGGLGVADAAEIAATAMTQFGLQGKDVPHIADLLAQAAGSAQGEVSDMAQALNQSGLIAAQFGISVDDTATSLALFAKNGLLGSDAGTSFKTMLMRLANPSGEAADTMKQLGINAYDAQGQFIGMTALADQLQDRLAGLSDQQRQAALSTIFGSDAIRAATVLYERGGEGLAQMSDDMRGFGSAADVAKIKMDNLKGDLEGLSGAFETALIGLGEGGQGPLRSLVQGTTDAINAFNNLSDGTKQGVTVTVAALAGLALGAAALGKIAIAAVEARTALVALGLTGPRVAAGLSGITAVAGPAAVALLGVAAAASTLNQLGTQTKGIDELEAGLTAIAKGQGDLNAAFAGSNWADELMGSLTTGIQPAKDLQSALTGLTASQDTTLGKISRWRETITPGTQSFEKAEEQVSALDGALASMVSKGNGDQAAAALQKMGVSSEQVARFFPQYSSALKTSASAAAASASGSEAAAAGADKAGSAAQQAAADFKAATDEMYANANAALAMSGNAIAVEQAMDDAAKAAKKNGENLDINTAKGRANQAALDQLASTTLTATQAMVDNNASAEKIVGTNERAKASWIANAKAMGMSRDEAVSMANSLFKIPKEIRSQVVVAGAKVSKQEATDLNKALKDIPPEKRAEIVTIAETKGAKAAKKAMDEVHAKDVLAKTVGDIKGAKNVDDAMKALRDRLVKAKASGDKKGADIVRAAMNLLKDKEVDAKANAIGKGAVDALRGSVNALHDKSVTATVTTIHNVKKRDVATGGLVTHGGVLYRSNGGPVWGAGTATSDSIPAMLSNGEFVINAKSVSMIGADRLAFMNRTGQLPAGYATGGIVSGIPAGVDINRIYALITALTRPLAAVQAANTALIRAQSAKSREDRELAAAKTAYERAVAADKKRNTKGTEAAKDKAKAAYDKAVDQQKDATEKLTDATNNLRSAQQTLADSARAASDKLSAPYRSGSSDIMDWLESMKQGAAELKVFQSDLAALRKLGVSETIVQQIADQGAVAGSELAKQILAGGRALAGALNTANGNLQKSADALGYDVIQATGRYALGGPVFGPGTGTSDSITARLSNGEYVVNAAATAANRGLLDHINYGRSVVAPARFAQTHYAHGGFVRTGAVGVNSSAIAAAVQEGLSRASFTGYIDGQPFRMIVKAEMRQTGRTLARSA